MSPLPIAVSRLIVSPSVYSWRFLRFRKYAVAQWCSRLFLNLLVLESQRGAGLYSNHSNSESHFSLWNGKAVEDSPSWKNLLADNFG